MRLVAGFANIAVEAVVTEWTADHVVGQNILFLDQAKTIINQWMGRELADLDGLSLSNYAVVTSTLNDPERLKRLNVNLTRDALLEARRVAVDAAGIQLVKSFEVNLEKEMALRKQAELRKLEAEAALRVVENERDCAKIRAEAELALIRAKADATADQVRELIAAGLDPASVANLLAIEVASLSVSKAQRVFVNMPSSLMGLRGAAGNIFHPAGDEHASAGYEKVE